jgi:hypothetical protein
VHHFRLQTPWKIKSIRGATFKAMTNGVYEVQLLRRSSQQTDGYANARVDVVFENP